MNWQEWKDKVDKAVEKKGILPENLHVEYIYFSGVPFSSKARISILKRRKAKIKDGFTHDLFVMD